MEKDVPVPETDNVEVDIHLHSVDLTVRELEFFMVGHTLQIYSARLLVHLDNNKELLDYQVLVHSELVILAKMQFFCLLVSMYKMHVKDIYNILLCHLRSIAADSDHFVQRLSVRPSICPCVCPVVTLSW